MATNEDTALFTPKTAEELMQEMLVENHEDPILRKTTFEESTKILSFDEMMKLCDEVDNFDWADEEAFGVKTRVFNYRLSIFDSFDRPGARNFRGSVYRLDTKQLVALPFFKFFNINENPFTYFETINEYEIKNIYEKVDGSLIYFYKINGNLCARTKRYFNNEYAQKAMKIVEKTKGLREYIEDWIDRGYTPMFEMISAFNQLVIIYDFETLCFLAARNMKTGEIVFADSDNIPYTDTDVVSVFPIYDEFKCVKDVVNECIYTEFDDKKDYREGYTIVFKNGEIVKIKRKQYIETNRILESADNDKCIVSALFEETLDDIIGTCRNNKAKMGFINNIIQCVEDTWIKPNKEIKKLWEKYKDLPKKEYVAKFKEEEKNSDYIFFFPVAMQLYDLNGDMDLERTRRSYFTKRYWRSSKFYEGLGKVR